MAGVGGCVAVLVAIAWRFGAEDEAGHGGELADFTGDELVHGDAHLDVGGGFFHLETGEQVHFWEMAARPLDGGGIPKPLADEQLVFEGFQRAEGVFEPESFGGVLCAPMVGIHAVAHEQYGHPAGGAEGGCSCLGTPDSEGFHPRQAEGDADATEEMAARERGGVRFHGGRERERGN